MAITKATQGVIDPNICTTDTTQTITGEKTFTQAIIADLTGNVTGDLTGDVTGDVTGDLTGNVTGNVTATSVSTTNLVNGSSLCFRNKIINGNFDIWQRGTSLASGTGGRYIADRFADNSIGSTYTASQQSFVVGQTDVPNNPSFFHRTVVSSVSGNNNFCAPQQYIEGVQTLSGTTSTLSFYAKADSAKSISIEFLQYFGTGGTPSPTVLGIGVQKLNLTTSWQKFTVTANIPSIAGKIIGSNNDSYLAITFFFDAGSNYNARTNSLGQQSGTFDIAQVQLEEGSVATPFENRPIGTELALCQRYYFAFPVSFFRQSMYNSASSGCINNNTLPVEMRVIPTIIQPTFSYVNASGAIITSINKNAVRVGWTCTNLGSTQIDHLAGGEASAEL
jgi:hypothetical protein